MDKSQLQLFLDKGYSTYKVAKLVGKSQTTVMYWIKKFGLAIPRLTSFVCCTCGETDSKKFHNKGAGRLSLTKCKACHNAYTIARFRENKRLAVKYKGGRCVVCGYDKCLGSLHFHHREPSKKDPNWHNMKSWKFERIKKELDKCDLICANCHGEIHWDEGSW